MTYLYFQGEPSGFISKDSILGEFRRSVEVRGSPGHPEQGNKCKTGKARPCIKAHGRAPKSHQHRPARKVARPGRVGWHDRAPRHGQVVLLGTAVPDGAARGLKLFRDDFVRQLLFFLLSVLLRFRERLKRVMKTLD